MSKIFGEFSNLMTQAMQRAVEGLDIGRLLVRYVDDVEGLSRVFRTALLANELLQEDHGNICVPFVITDADGNVHRFEAVGFRQKDECEISIEEAFRRVGERVVQSKEDWKLINDHSYQLPGKLRESVFLLTKRPNRRGPDCVSIFYWDKAFWIGDYHRLGQLCGHGLVLRRSA